jgi:hypothetical protein
MSGTAITECKEERSVKATINVERLKVKPAISRDEEKSRNVNERTKERMLSRQSPPFYRYLTRGNTRYA